MKREEALDQMWVRDKVGRVGFLIRSANGWDVAHATETRQSVDLADYEYEERPPAPAVIDVRGNDSAGGLKEKRRK